MPLNLRFHDVELSVCKLEADISTPVDLPQHTFAAYIHTPGEVTLICPASAVPENVKKEESGWIALELVGPFDFALTGILLQVAKPLAKAGIAIYTLSTYDTDYVLIKAERRQAAIEALKQAGHNFIV